MGLSDAVNYTEENNSVLEFKPYLKRLLLCIIITKSRINNINSVKKDSSIPYDFAKF